MKVKVKSLSRVQFFVTPWTVAYKLLHQWDFPGKNTGVGCHFLLQPFPPSGDLPDPGIELKSPAASALQGDALLLSPWRNPMTMFTDSKGFEEL